ncbi:hypothetical protein ACFLU6_04410 [Acidobacteriota bacterium]
MTEHQLTIRQILKFYLPLVLTAQMMTLSAPIINTGLGRSDDPKLAIAAYAVGFILSLFLHSPLFVTQQVTTALSKNRRNFLAIARFFLTGSVILSILDTVVAQTLLGDIIFVDLIGATPRISVEAKIVVQILAPIPVLIAVRGIFQALAIQRKRTILVTASTFSRLLILITAMLIGVFVFHLRGASAGAVALSLGILVETIAIVLQCRRYIPPALSKEEPENPNNNLTQGRILRFAIPPMLNTLTWTLQRSLINAIISRTGEPVLALAGFGLVHPLLLLTASPMWALHPTSLVMPVTLRDVKKLRCFVLILATCLSLIILIVSVAAGYAILDRVYAATEELLLFTLPALFLIFPEPVFLGLRAFSIGLILKSGKTRIMAVAAANKILSIAVFGTIALAVGWPKNGAVLGVLLMLVADMLDMFIHFGWIQGRLRRAPETGPWTGAD